MDLKTQELYWSAEFYRQLGLEPSKHRPSVELAYNRSHPDDRPALQKMFEAACAGTNRQASCDYRLIPSEGTERAIHAELKVIVDQDNVPIRLVGTTQDVTEMMRTREELEQSQQSLADAQRIANLGNWSVNLKTRELSFSDQLYRQLGLDSSMHRPSTELVYDQVNPDDRAVIQERIQAVLAGPSRVASCDHRLISSEGVERIVHAEFKVIVDQYDVPIRLVGTVQDVTEMRRAREELERSERMLAEAQRIAKIGSWEAALQTGELRWSDGFYQIAGLDPAKHAPSVELFLSLVHPDDRSELVRKTEVVFTAHDRYVPGDYRIVRPDGTECSIRAEADSLKDQSGRPVRIIGTIQDVTLQRAAEKELRSALDLAKAADRAKSEFLANMSHELRTPLNAIIGFSELLMSEISGPPGSARQKEYLEDIHNSGEHLLDVINGILNLSKIEAGQTALEEEIFELSEIIDWTLRLVREKARRAGVELQVDAATDVPILRADARLLRQALLNLITNAIKFTRSGGWVRVQARQSEGGDLVMAISDSGIGMTPEGIAVALSPFGQVDSSLQRKFEGTGLGLPLAKKFIELHGGELAIESMPAKGTTVTVILPRSRCLFGADLTVRH